MHTRLDTGLPPLGYDANFAGEQAYRFFVQANDRRNREVRPVPELRRHPLCAAMRVAMPLTHAGQRFARQSFARLALDTLASHHQTRLDPAARRVANADIGTPVPPDISAAAGWAVVVIRIDRDPRDHAVVLPFRVFQPVARRGNNAKLSDSRIEANSFNHLFRIVAGHHRVNRIFRTYWRVERWLRPLACQKAPRACRRRRVDGQDHFRSDAAANETVDQRHRLHTS